MEDLDVEFLQLLSQIKPYIACIMNNTDIELIKMWLEKLNNENITDKKARNKFLLCLGKQIQEGELEPPFNMKPPENLKFQIHKKSKFQAYHSPSFEVSANKPKYKNKLKRKKISKAISCKTSSDVSLLPSLPEDNYVNDALKNEFKIRSTPNFLTQICKHQKKLDYESSWQDASSYISDYDKTSGGGDAKNRIDDITNSDPLINDKIEKLFHIIEQLRNENFILKEQKREIDGRSDIGNKSEMQAILNEVDNLKSKLNELLLMKSTMQSSKLSLESESQNTILVMNKKLTALQNKNNEFRNTIQEMEKMLADKSRNDVEIEENIHQQQIETLKKRHKDELDKSQNAFGIEMNRKFYEYNEKINELKIWYETQLLETEKSLQMKHKQEIEGLHKSLEKQMKEFCEKKEDELKDVYESKHKLSIFSLDETKAHYETQIDEIKKDFEKTLTCKSGEIARLESLLEEQCKRMQAEVEILKEKMEKDCDSEGLEETVRFLQKCIFKMDKLYKRAEKKYAAQVLRLKHEIVIRDRHNQILLTTERVRLISSNSVGKQKQIDEIVNKLEQYYKKILIEEQVRAMEDKKNDLKLISELRGQIALDKIYT